MESIAQIPGNNLAELLQRTCLEPATFGPGLVNLSDTGPTCSARAW